MRRTGVVLVDRVSRVISSPTDTRDTTSPRHDVTRHASPDHGAHLDGRDRSPTPEATGVPTAQGTVRAPSHVAAPGPRRSLEHRPEQRHCPGRASPSTTIRSRAALGVAPWHDNRYRLRRPGPDEGHPLGWVGQGSPGSVPITRSGGGRDPRAGHRDLLRRSRTDGPPEAVGRSIPCDAITGRRDGDDPGGHGEQGSARTELAAPQGSHRGLARFVGGLLHPSVTWPDSVRRACSARPSPASPMRDGAGPRRRWRRVPRRRAGVRRSG